MGALIRAFLINIVPGGFLPWAIIMANITGCFLIGMLWILAVDLYWDQRLFLLIFTGILGGLTTFSTYMLDSLELMLSGEITRGLLNIILSNFLGIAVIFGGFYTGKLILMLLKA